MQDNANSELLAPKQIPWNKGKLTTPSSALRRSSNPAGRNKRTPAPAEVLS